MVDIDFIVFFQNLKYFYSIQAVNSDLRTIFGPGGPHPQVLDAFMGLTLCTLEMADKK